ncbi:hypothetical protein [Chitinivorax sp. B]|uniref:hypothetical protein n=1 Tax=Chitinivorax sp. B TaxID=2502235 RepID=UPI0010F4C6A4|nr:hypothetical protein [Chitinivorax sp. B]
MNELLRFLVELVGVLTISTAIIAYLRGVLRNILSNGCDEKNRGPDFWIRICDVMMLISPVIMVILFGHNDNVSLTAEVKRVLLLTLLGNFVGLTLVISVIWKYLVQPQLDRNVGFTTVTR